MFKLESYITPWLLSYIDQYVKLRREDFQLSLWGGDVVLYNLELRLANIQKLVPTLPIIFQSGIIHELRIHIPWIRINSEPIVVTINQIELVIVLNKERSASTDCPPAFASEIDSQQILLQQQQPTTPEQSNYIQSVLARILNNVQIVVNNLIVKFIEGDIVLSLSSRTAQCYAVNSNWTKAFVELSQQDPSLRRLITLPDLTLCLDKRDLNGKVHRYEVPLLSRCSFECRLQMFYSNVYQQLNTKPIQTRLSFNCANIEVSIVDNQLSMIRRLVEVIMVAVHQQIQSETNEEKTNTTVKDVQPSPPPSPSPLALLPPPLPPLPPLIPTENKTVEVDNQQTGWVSWAWSYVPSVTTLFAEDDASEETIPPPPLEQQIKTELPLQESNIPISTEYTNTPTPLLFAGIDLDRISLQYKVTKFHGEKSSLVPFIAFLVEKVNIIVERYKSTSTTAQDGESVVSRVRKVKVSTSKMSLTWDERLALSLADVQFTLHYDRHVRMTHFSLIVNDLHARFDHHLLIYPCQVTLKLDHHRTYSLLHSEISSVTGKINFQILAHLIRVINQIRTIVDIATNLFHPMKTDEIIDNDIISVDDLRNGSMKCTFQSTNDLPKTNEISFTTTSNHNLASCMTWKYPQRRSILKCHILPLPFVDDFNGVVPSHRMKMVDCLMQYWHFGTKQFVTWQTFELTDGQPLFLDFSNDLGQNPYSEMWRIVLVNASSIINQATSLAASTRIDSLQSQRYEPSIEMTIKIPNIRLHFLIDPSSEFTSILNGCQHDAATLTLDNLSFDYSQRLETRLISIETILSLETLEYRFLTKRPCLEPTLINLDLFIDTSKSSLSSNLPDIFEINNSKYNQLFRSPKTSIVCQLHFDIDHINIRISQSLCHLINILYQHWMQSEMIEVLNLTKFQQQILPKASHQFYYTYYLFTNHLNCPIDFQQIDTHEQSLHLPSSSTKDFVWSKLSTEKLLIEFALGENRSLPMDIHQTEDHGKQLIPFENLSHLIYFQMDFDEHHIRRHIHIFSPLLFKNLCDFDINLRLDLTDQSKQIDLLLSKTHSYLSCLEKIEEIEAIQWNSSVQYPLDQFNSNGLLSTSDQTSIWIHLHQIDHYTCLVFAPVVIYRSFLTQDVLLHLNKDKPFLLESNGIYTYYHQFQFDNPETSYEHYLQQVDAEQFTDCVFQLKQESYTSVPSPEEKPSVSIDQILQVNAPSSSKQSILDLLREEHEKIKENDEDIPIPLIEQANEILNASLLPTMGANGPAMYEPTLPSPTKKAFPTSLISNSIDCRIEPIRFHSNLNTILIQLKPLTLINNLTPFNFHFYANAGHHHIYIPCEQITCLSKLEYSQIQLILIDPNDGEHMQCQTIDLIFRNIPLRNPSTHLIHHRLYTNNSLDLYFIKSSNNDYFIVQFKHDYLDHTHIFTIQSKYRFFNQTNSPLLTYILPVSKQQYLIDYPYLCEKLPVNDPTSLYRFQGIPSTDLTYYFLFQVDSNDKSQFLSKPVQLCSITDDNENRQCFCLFQKDEQLKMKSSNHQSLCGDFYVIHQSLNPRSNQIDISIHSNTSWAFLQVINTCSCPLLCRLENISSMSHIIPPFSSAFIGIDSSEHPSTTSNVNVNNLENLMNNSRFYLAQYQSTDFSSNPIQLITSYFQQITKKSIQWSRPIKFDSQFEDVFLPVPGLHDVLIRSHPISLAASRTILIEPVQRQRQSKPSLPIKPSNSLSMQSTIPNTTFISETTPRQYRSNHSEKTSPINSTSNATNQYLKLCQQQYSQKNHRQVQLNFLITKISISLMDELENISLFREILRVTIEKVNVLFYQHLIDFQSDFCQQQFFCSFEQFQIDNQCFSPKTNFDFPVLLMSKDERRVSKKPTNLYESKAFSQPFNAFTDHHRQNSSSSIDTTLTEDPLPAFDSLTHNHKKIRSNFLSESPTKFFSLHFHRINQRFIKIEFQIQPLDVYIEDQYIYFLLKIFSDLLPLDLTLPQWIRKNPKKIEQIEARLLKTPFVCESLQIGAINITISVHASLKVYIGCHQLPIVIDTFQKNFIYSSNKQLLTIVTRHYLLSLLTRSPILLGSFDLLGNPSVLIRNITDGIYDLFHLPYVGMRQGPSGFMLGISEGATSLLKHLSLGTLTSLTTFANSVARNMDRLAMDTEHTTRTEETCRHIPIGMTSGLLQGLELFSLSLLGAVAGLAEQPLASLRNRDDSQPATTSVLSGMGKGLVGIVAKPVGGVAQLISQTGQGILYGTGLMNIPHRRHRQIEQDARINTNISYLKLFHICRLEDDEILDSLDYVLEYENIEHGILILTRNRRLIMYHKDDENQHESYLLNEVELSESPDSSGLLVFNNLAFYVDPRLRHQFLALCRLLQ